MTPRQEFEGRAYWVTGGHKEVSVDLLTRHDHVCAVGHNERASPLSESPVKIWDTKTGELVVNLKGRTIR